MKEPVEVEDAKLQYTCVAARQIPYLRYAGAVLACFTVAGCILGFESVGGALLYLLVSLLVSFAVLLSSVIVMVLRK